MFEMMNGIVLFDGEREQDLFRNILHQPIELPKTMSKAAQDVRHVTTTGHLKFLLLSLPCDLSDPIFG